jgi:S-adenosylmethionine-diacylgycerolhomoserine-N-methlytransferase
MLDHARRKCSWASLIHGFAEKADYASVLGAPPERVLFSYCLSMVHEPAAALAQARAQVAPGGEVVVVDFADLGGFPGPARRLLGGWLETFHVEPQRVLGLVEGARSVSFGPGRYYVIARFSRA